MLTEFLRILLYRTKPRTPILPQITDPIANCTMRGLALTSHVSDFS